MLARQAVTAAAALICQAQFTCLPAPRPCLPLPVKVAAMAPAIKVLPQAVPAGWVPEPMEARVLVLSHTAQVVGVVAGVEILLSPSFGTGTIIA
jgi:hypothetical protein